MWMVSACNCEEEVDRLQTAPAYLSGQDEQQLGDGGGAALLSHGVQHVLLLLILLCWHLPSLLHQQLHQPGVHLSKHTLVTGCWTPSQLWRSYLVRDQPSNHKVLQFKNPFKPHGLPSALKDSINPTSTLSEHMATMPESPACVKLLMALFIDDIKQMNNWWKLTVWRILSAHADRLTAACQSYLVTC